jgi:hypothetical protein
MISFFAKKGQIIAIIVILQKANFCDNHDNRDEIIVILRLIQGYKNHPGVVEAHPGVVEAQPGAE